MLVSFTKGGNSDMHSSTGEPRTHYARCNMPVTKGDPSVYPLKVLRAEITAGRVVAVGARKRER